MRRVVFWIVWVLSVVIALVSSFVTFCNTQKNNLYNQFNTKIRRELWSYLTLSGRYMVLEQHLASSAAGRANERLLGDTVRP